MQKNNLKKSLILLVLAGLIGGLGGFAYNYFIDEPTILSSETGPVGASVFFPYQGGTGLSTYRKGDIIFGNATNVLATLASGSTDQVLKISSGVPVWGTDVGVAPSGSNNQVLTDDGSSGLVSETNLTFDGSLLDITGAASISTNFEVGGYASISNTLFVDTGTDGRVGVGTNAPETLLHTALGSAGTDPTWNATVDVAIFESSNNAAIQIFTSGESVGHIAFSRPGARSIGFIRYDHAAESMDFFVDNGERLSITSAGLTTVSGNIVPEADGTRDLGIQTTAQWANLWSDLVNGADYSMANKWRMLESELYEGYPSGWAIGHNKEWEDGKSVYKNPEMIGNNKPTFVVTDEFLEYKGRRITPEMLDKIISLADKVKDK